MGLGCLCPQPAVAQAPGLTPPGVADWVNAVLTSHPLVRARREEAQAAEADVRAARWQYWPTPSVTVDTLRGQAATVTRLSQPVWDGGKISAGVRQSDIRLRLATLNLRETEHELAAKVLGFWQTHSVQAARLQVFERGLQSLQDLDELMSRRTDAGVSAQADLTLARVRLMQTRADLLQARASQISALGQLRQLAQQEPAGRPVDATPWVADVEAGVERLRELARAQHPVVDRLTWQRELQQAELVPSRPSSGPLCRCEPSDSTARSTASWPRAAVSMPACNTAWAPGVSVLPKLEAVQVRL
ncbi:MAG: hypothetical protein EBV79_12260, partial [Betaproteobacteria bacterium]|nr:hypothetical protein [Betaproteobacteria bacterium]